MAARDSAKSGVRVSRPALARLHTLMDAYPGVTRLSDVVEILSHATIDEMHAILTRQIDSREVGTGDAE